MKFSAPCPVVKQKHGAWNTRLGPISKFGAMMTGIFLQKWLSFERLKYFEILGCVVKCPNPRRRSKPPKQKGVHLKGPGR